MKKGQLVKIKDTAKIEVIGGSSTFGTEVYVVVKGPYEGIFSEGRYSRLAKVVDILTPAGDIVEKVECAYLARVS